MIQKYSRDRGENYYNAVLLTWLFFLSEITEILIYLKIYDVMEGEVSTTTINFRRLFWTGVGTIFTFSLLSLLTVTCISHLTTIF